MESVWRPRGPFYAFFRQRVLPSTAVAVSCNDLRCKMSCAGIAMVPVDECYEVGRNTKVWGGVTEWQVINAVIDNARRPTPSLAGRLGFNQVLENEVSGPANSLLAVIGGGESG